MASTAPTGTSSTNAAAGRPPYRRLGGHGGGTLPAGAEFLTEQVKGSAVLKLDRVVQAQPADLGGRGPRAARGVPPALVVEVSPAAASRIGPHRRVAAGCRSRAGTSRCRSPRSCCSSRVRCRGWPWRPLSTDAQRVEAAAGLIRARRGRDDVHDLHPGRAALFRHIIDEVTVLPAVKQGDCLTAMAIEIGRHAGRAIGRVDPP